MTPMIVITYEMTTIIGVIVSAEDQESELAKQLHGAMDGTFAGIVQVGSEIG